MAHTVVPVPNRGALLVLLCFGGFTSVFGSLVMIPLIPPIAEDFQVGIPTAGLLITAPALLAAASSLVIGSAIDRFGTRIFIVAGMGLLTAMTLLSAMAPAFGMLLAIRAIVGLSLAGITPAMLVVIARRFGYEERGKAIGWYFSATTAGPIFGLPLASIIADALSWRWTFVLLALLTLLTTLLLERKLPVDDPAERATHRAQIGMGGALRTVARDRVTMAALWWNVLATACWMQLLTYLAAYFYHQFALPTWALGLLNTVASLGFLIGSNGGGRLADRMGKRAVILGAGALSVVFGALLTTVAALPVALLCLLLFAIPNGARNTGGQALLSELLPHMRGTVLALASAGAHLGIVGGSILGGAVIQNLGYWYMGPVSAGLFVLATFLFWAMVPESVTVTEPVPTKA